MEAARHWVPGFLALSQWVVEGLARVRRAGQVVQQAHFLYSPKMRRSPLQAGCPLIPA
jgi:hypothetical protein